MKKTIQKLAVLFTTMLIGLICMSYRVYADIIVPEPDPSPVPDPAPSSSIVLIIAGLLVVCVVIASVLILRKIKKHPEN